tara:strand:+ start:209 stop:529 length:321 start_codon:yes stop_codon:yes gene_type:complete
MEKIEILEILRQKIENLDKFHQIEILKILHENVDNSILNQNNNGTFINLSNVDDSVIHKLQSYLKYVITQETQLNDLESQKEQFKTKYFQKENKDKIVQSNNECNP